MNPLVVSVALPELNFVCRVGAADASAPGPDPRIPELEILNHYAGVWEDEISENSWKRTEIGEWVLDGSFLRQSWITERNDGLPTATGITMMTYDHGKRAYLSWSFLAISSVIHNQGEWDTGTRTMTWTDRLSGNGEMVISKATFIEGATNVWSIVENDPNGKVIREVTGKSTRRRH